MFSGFSRRQFLRLISLSMTGSAIGSVPFVGKFFISKAQAQQTTEEEVYKGTTYTIVTSQTDANQIQQAERTTGTVFNTSVQLFIANEQVPIAQDNSTQKYLSSLLFAEFNSPDEVARTIIDVGLQLPITEVQLDPNVD